MGDVRLAHWSALIGCVAVVIGGAFALPHLAPAPALQENRVLADPPAAPSGLGGLTAFRKATDAYVADHFPPRRQLIGALNALRMRLGVGGSSRVIVGRDGWLFSDNGSHLGAARADKPLTDADAAAWLDGLAGRTEAMRAEGRAYVLLIPPVKEAVYPDRTPRWFKLDINRPAVTLATLAQVSGAGEVVYPHAAIDQQARWGLHTYDRYDSHWTGLGAYHGYVAFMRSLHRQNLAEAPRPLEQFEEVRDRSGVPPPSDLALMLGVASFVNVDHPEFVDPAAGQTLRVTYLTDKRDWTGLHVIDTGQAGKPVLLMTVDSFSNALIPFLYGHFSRIIVAHLQDGPWRRDLIDRFKPDIVAMEVVESGAPLVMGGSPTPSAEAQARVRAVVADRARYAIASRTPTAPGRRRPMEGGSGKDTLQGSADSDEIRAYGGDDTVDGREGDDVIRAGRGRDIVDGGPGDDWISGDRDDDILRGGPGADTFHAFAGAGTDQVLDFKAAEGDRVEILLGYPYRTHQVGPDVVIELQGAKLILRGVALADLPSGWIGSR